MISALVFIILIVNIATNPESILKLNLPFMEKLGEVSYGFYMYHFPALYIVWFSASKAGFDGIRTSPFLLLGITFVITLAMAVMSFRWLESPFLRLKKRLTPTFITGDQIKYIRPAIQ
jgi:peptidoglycan/LPS O-acetylase OafA/YrhL